MARWWRRPAERDDEPPLIPRVVNHAPKFRRLKELATQNRDHDAALRFFASEQRAKRWSREYGWWRTLLDYLYAGACNYGQSILLPLFWLLGVWAVAAALFLKLADESPNAVEAMIVAASNSLPFLSIASAARAEAFGILYGPLIPWYVDVVAGVQGLLSFIFLFLIGLGLRNRFRV